MDDEFKPPSDETYHWIQMRQRCIGSAKHHDLMAKLYSEYMDSNGKLTCKRVSNIEISWDEIEWLENTKKIKDAELQNTINPTQRIAKIVKDHVNSQALKDAQNVKP